MNALRVQSLPDNHTHSSQPHARAFSSLPYSSSPSSSSLPAPSRSLLTVIPPTSLQNHFNPQHQPCSLNGPAFSRGALIPLYPSLNAQLAAIAREYGLPSSAGMVLYLIEGSPQAGHLATHLAGGPRIGQEAWQLLWAAIFEEEEADAFQQELLARERIHYLHHLQLDLLPRPPPPPLSNRTDDDLEVLDPSLSSATDDPEPSLPDFPAPPLLRKPPWPLPPRRASQDEDQARSTRLSGRSSPSTASVDSSPHTLNSPRHNDLRFIRSRQPSLTASGLPSLTSKLRPIDHPSPDFAIQQHLPALSSPSYQSTFRPPFANPSRPPTTLSHLPHLSSGRASSLASRLERDSVYSSASRASRRVGAGVIVGKIEFDFDTRRPNGRWYELWLNGNSSVPGASPLDDSPRTIPLLLPDLVSRRNRSPNPASPRAHPRRLHTQPPRRAPLAIPTDDSNQPPSPEASDPDPSQTGYQRLDSPASDQPETAQTGSDDIEGDPLAAVFGSDEQTWLRLPKVDISEPEPDHDTLEQPGSEVEEVVAMLARLEPTREHNSHLSSPIKLDSSPPPLKTAPSGGPQWAACQEECGSEQAGSTNATTSPSSGEPETAPDVLLRPSVPPGSAKRSSSMAMEANLDELEQALAALSPRALRLAPAPRANLAPRSVDAGRVRCAEAARAAVEEGHRRAGTAGSTSGGGRGGMHKFLDSLHDSYVDRKPRSRGPEGAGGKSRDEARERRAGRRGSAGSGASGEKIRSRANGLVGKAVSAVGGKIKSATAAANGGFGLSGSGEGQTAGLAGQRKSRTRKNSSSSLAHHHHHHQQRQQA